MVDSKDILTSCIAVVVLLALGACSSSTPVTDAPAETDELMQIRQQLVGTWTHTHVADEDGDRRSVGEREASWTFEEDGTGIYSERSPESDVPEESPFRWQLEGRNIRLDLDSEEPTYFRTEEWGEGEMTWFNYRQSNYFVVQQAR